MNGSDIPCKQSSASLVFFCLCKRCFLTTLTQLGPAFILEVGAWDIWAKSSDPMKGPGFAWCSRDLSGKSRGRGGHRYLPRSGFAFPAFEWIRPLGTKWVFHRDCEGIKACVFTNWFLENAPTCWVFPCHSQDSLWPDSQLLAGELENEAPVPTHPGPGS